MLNYVQRMAGFHDFSHNFVIKKSLEGYRKQKAKADSRIPITPVILKKLIETLQHMNLPEFTQILLKAMCLLAFHAFLRVGEITQSGSKIFFFFIAFSSVKFLIIAGNNPHAVQLNMEQFKHSTGKSCHKLQIQCNDKHPGTFPVHALWDYCQIRGSQPGSLFCFLDGKSVSRQFFTQHLKLLLYWAGCNNKNYKGHSFRIGEASMGISNDRIQIMGRWHSDAFEKYVRIPLLNL